MTHAKLIARLSNLDGPIKLWGDALDFAREFYPDDVFNRGFLIDALQGSIDAAVSLAERVLPDERVWINRIAFEGRCQWRASLTGNYTSYSAHPAIALIIAVLKAKEAGNGEE